jgi:branched-chain amino acid transport system ATP-binding protein
LKQSTLEKFQKFQIKKQKQLDILKPKLEEAKQKLIDLLKQDHSSENLLEKLDNEHILKIENLTMMFGGLKAVDDLSFEVKQNEIFGLIGPNGAGKTTVFNCITQFYKPNAGNLYYKNRNQEVVSLTSFKVHDVIKQGIVRTFQNVELIFELSVLDNMLVGAHSMYKSKFFTQLFHLPRLLREEVIMKTKALNILKDLGLYVYKDFYPIGLPYGILKKIELARTLMTNPNLIILDEPAAGLNDMETKDLAQTIRKIQKTYNCTIFLVEHDMQLVMDICDTICAISFGKKLAIGAPREIKNNKVVQEAYLGGD